MLTNYSAIVVLRTPNSSIFFNRSLDFALISSYLMLLVEITLIWQNYFPL